MIIHRRVFEKIAELGGPCWFIAMPIPMDVAGEPEWEELGEDLAFCKRAKNAGFQTWLARGLKLKHHKSAALEELVEAPPAAFPMAGRVDVVEGNHSFAGSQEVADGTH
jgi:hypothetical protein